MRNERVPIVRLAARSMMCLTLFLVLLGATCGRPGPVGVVGSPDRGRAAFAAQRCGSCHDAVETVERPSVAPHPIQDASVAAPSLQIAGSKYLTEWIVEFLGGSRAVEAGGSGEPAGSGLEERTAVGAKEAADIAAYLASRTDAERLAPASGIAFDPADWGAVSEGERMYRSLGCPACHAIGGEGDAIGPRLDAAGHRLRPAYIAAAIRDPQRVRPGSEMPDLDMGDDVIRLLTAYLASLKR
jgi:mono/diheme cytochrome c family protein